MISTNHDLGSNRISPTTIIDLPNTVNGKNNVSDHQPPSNMLMKRKSTRASIDLSSSGTVSFHNINYIVGGSLTNGQKKKCSLPCIKPKSGKQILYNVSGIFTPGMNAIMGKKQWIIYTKFFL
jgi:hypothetical protein